MTIPEILKTYKTIAVVGVSDNPTRPSHTVTKYMLAQGYTIIPVNPTIESVFGLKCYPSLLALPDELKRAVEIVNVFRKPDDVPPVVDDAIAIGAKVVWMQLGITNQAAVDHQILLA
jgi:uncharacterized protein